MLRNKCRSKRKALAKNENFTKISSNAEKALSSISGNHGSILDVNAPIVSTDKSSMFRKRIRNTAENQVFTNTNKLKVQKKKENGSDFFPDDSFNSIVSQMPESELRVLTGENVMKSPALNRIENEANKRGSETLSLNFSQNDDSSFEIQMSQMNDSQYMRFMDDC